MQIDKNEKYRIK
ncbi:MAG: hypothetical protein IIX45_05850 [Lachnospiraceae bacterium]|nr:hypothetical protein [Lachnospiraceae bacterium]